MYSNTIQNNCISAFCVFAYKYGASWEPACGNIGRNTNVGIMSDVHHVTEWCLRSHQSSARHKGSICDFLQSCSDWLNSSP